MQDQYSSKAELYEELEVLRARVAELERTLAGQPLGGEQMVQRPPLNGSLDTRSRSRVDRALESQRRFFKQLAAGAPLGLVLDILARNVESQIDGGLCSIELLDEDGLH